MTTAAATTTPTDAAVAAVGNPAVGFGLEDTTRHALRLLTAGSVDDGKSTLIGRLLYDSRALLADQIGSLRSRGASASTKVAGGPDFDLSLLTDGLEAEREQGITIDVAFRYFATPRRKFILADAPGHEQYTRNMVTAAAGSDAAVVLVDVTKLRLGVLAAGELPALLPQTRRHALLARLLRVPSIVFAVNKIDTLADPGAGFAAVRASLQRFTAEAGIEPAAILPVSALRGDNVVEPLQAPWYSGPSLLALLETLPAGSEAIALGMAASQPLRLPVQYVARALESETRDTATDLGMGMGEQPRILWGRVAAGTVQPGDEVQVFPSGQRARVAALRNADGPASRAAAGHSAGVVLDRQLDVSRGDWLAAPGLLTPVQRFTATLAWLDTEPAMPGRKYLLRHGHRWVQARLQAIHHRLDIQSLQPTAAQTLSANEIAEVSFLLQQPLPLAAYAQQRQAGSLIVVDPASHRTSGAVMVLDVAPAEDAAPGDCTSDSTAGGST